MNEQFGCKWKGTYNDYIHIHKKVCTRKRPPQWVIDLAKKNENQKRNSALPSNNKPILDLNAKDDDQIDYLNSLKQVNIIYELYFKRPALFAKLYKKEAPKLEDGSDTREQSLANLLFEEKATQLEKSVIRKRMQELKSKEERQRFEVEQIIIARRKMGQKIYENAHAAVKKFNEHMMAKMAEINFDKNHQERKNVQNQLYLGVRELRDQLGKFYEDIEGIQISIFY